MNSPHVPAELRRYVLNTAGGRCAYCRSAEALMGVTFEVEHIISRSAGGETKADNLCLSCPPCNRHKSARLTVLDPKSGKEVPLYHPNHQVWSDHFAWSEDSTRVVGLTAVGRATIIALRMNRHQIVQLRRYWVALGLHPPEGGWVDDDYSGRQRQHR